MVSIKSKIRKYEKIIIAFLEEQVAERKAFEPSIMFVCDKERKHYQLLFSGWLEKNYFTHDLLIHLHIVEDGKVWLLANETETLVGQELAKRGIPKSDIVIGFQTPEQRKLTEFAVG